MNISKVLFACFTAGICFFGNISSLFADRLEQMISPISNPVNFEDPRIISEIRPVFMYHELEDDFITGGGDVQLYALQLRLALSENLALIATKDGFIDFNPTGLPDQTGFANIAAGLKYSFYKSDNSIATAGLRYEAPLGNRDVFQGNGDGQVNPFISAAVALETINIVAGTGFRLPIDDADSTFYDFDLHVDYPIDNFYPTVELNVVHTIDGGERLPMADEGQDLFNFGSTMADGKTLVTAAAGFRYRVCDDIDFGVAYQIPLTNGRGSNVTDWRVTADLIYRFEV